MQSHRTVPRIVTYAGLAAMALLAGCATATIQASPEQIPALEQAVARAPDDAEAATRLGIAYFMADRFADAQRTLQGAIEDGATDGSAHLYLGLAHEELEDWAAARAAYDQYLEAGTSSRTKDEIRGRLTLVARKQLREEARRALEQERVLSEQPPTPNSVAVLPFRLTGLSEEMQPLETALADMIITDLGLTSLQSLERVRVQSLIDEMVLAQAGFTTAESGARMGRMLKAEHVVQGIITGAGSDIVLDASVLRTAQNTTRGEVNRRGDVDAIFDLEKQIVFDILGALGHSITASEREAIMNNRTGSLVAFLAYGRGLEALDRGEYNEAMLQFNQATQLDPGFGAARAQQVEAQQLESASTTAASTVGEVAISEIAAAPVTTSMAAEIANQVNFSPAQGLSQTTQTVPTPGTSTQQRNPTTEQSSQPPVTQAATASVIITIPRPAGGVPQ